MTEVVYPQENEEPIVVDLRNPYRAAILAWLWPGAGHFYQHRFVKGFIFMICVLSTFFYGLGLGHGRVVYARFKPGDFRWQYICQLGVGAPALPALLQSFKTADGGDPFWVLAERFPGDYGFDGPNATEVDKKRANLRFRRIEGNDFENYDGAVLKDGLMAPPPGPILTNDSAPDVLARWHYELKHFFEIGTLYTVIAGLLNLLAVYDAFVGPMILTPRQKEELDSKKK